MKKTMKRLLSSLKRMDRITQVKPKPVIRDKNTPLTPPANTST